MPGRTNLSVKNRFNSASFKQRRSAVVLDPSVNREELSTRNDNGGNLVPFSPVDTEKWKDSRNDPFGSESEGM
jgi:hypothetical protein